MNETLRIADELRYCRRKDRKEYFTHVYLRFLLGFVREEGPSLHWAAIPSSESTLLHTYGPWGAGWELMERIHAPDKLRAPRVEIALTWEEMERVDEDTTSVEMATFVAARDPATLSKVRSFLDPYGSLDNAKEAFYEQVEFALSMVYGQAWQVWAKSRAVRERIVETFPDAQVVPWTEKLRARDLDESVA